MEMLSTLDIKHRIHIVKHKSEMYSVKYIECVIDSLVYNCKVCYECEVGNMRWSCFTPSMLV